MSQAYARALGAPLAIVAKNRVDAERVEALNVIGEVKGRNVLLVDDLTESAGTLTEATRVLLEHGAKNVYAGVSHAVLSDKGRDRLAKSPIQEVFATNSVPQAFGPKVTCLSVASLLADAMKRIHRDESITSLFDIRG
jgi:ribose-phosphate pyrophosphokinase